MAKNPPASAEGWGLILGLGRSPGGGHGNPLQHPCWEIPWTEEPGGLQSIGSPRTDTTKHTHAHTHTHIDTCVTLKKLFFFFWSLLPAHWASLIAQLVKRLSAMQGSQLQFLGREDLLEKKMATHCSILAWRFPWAEEPGGL